MKIGTWNLDGKWTSAHEALLREENCDVWLLTEVPPLSGLKDYYLHFSQQRMSRGQHYSAIWSRSAFAPVSDPHGASSAISIEGVTYCSSVLPWSSCGRQPHSPWSHGKPVSEMVKDTIDSLLENLPSTNLVWGGDWNQNLTGGWQYVGSKGGRRYLDDTLRKLDLQIPTKNLPHRIAGCYTIDHIALPRQWECSQSARIETLGLSDHDAYTINTTPR